MNIIVTPGTQLLSPIINEEGAVLVTVSQPASITLEVVQAATIGTVDVTGVDMISQMSDVTLTSLTDKNILQYDSETAKWINTAGDRYHDPYILSKAMSLDGTSLGNWSWLTALSATISHGADTMTITTTTTANSRVDIRDSDTGISGGPWAGWSTELYDINGLLIEGRVRSLAHDTTGSTLPTATTGGRSLFGIYRIHATTDQCIHAFQVGINGNWWINIVTETTQAVFVDTGVLASDWHTLRIEVDSQCSNIRFLIDGLVEYTAISGVIPLENLREYGTGIWFGAHVRMRTTCSNALSMEVDWMTGKMSKTPYHTQSLQSLYDVNTSGIVDTGILRYDTATDTFIAGVVGAEGTAGGDLSGTYPNPEVNKIHGYTVINTAPVDGDLLQWSTANNRWEYHAPAATGLALAAHDHSVIDDLTMFQSGTPADLDLWQYDTASGKWKHRSIAASGLGPTAHTHTIDDITDFLESRIVMETDCNAAGEFSTISLNGGSNTFNSTGLPVNGHYGILDANVDTVTKLSGIGATNTTDGVNFGTYKHSTTIICQIPTLSDATNRFIIECGYSDNRSGTATDAVYITYSDNINGGSWFGVAYNNTTLYSINLNIAVVAGTWYKLKTVINVDLSVSFYIDGVLAGTLAAGNAPTGSTRAVTLGNTIRKTVGSTARRIYIDYLNMIVDTNR